MTHCILILISVMFLNVNMSFSSPILTQADRALFEKIPFEKGPIPKAALEPNAQMSFLGTINGKNFYISRVIRTNHQGWVECHEAGMRLARFDTQEELDFVAGRMYASDDYAWTDGLNLHQNEGFRWGFYGNSLSGFQLAYADKLALTIGRHSPDPSRLVAEFDEREHYSICQN